MNQLPKGEQLAARVAKLERELQQEKTGRRLNQMNHSRKLAALNRNRLGQI